MRVCMVTTSFPRWQGDSSGIFVESLSDSLSKMGLGIIIVAPGHRDTARMEAKDSMMVHRFSYRTPLRSKRLAYDGGIPHKLKTSRLARLEVPSFLVSMHALTSRVARTCDLIHAHWIPTGAVAGLVAKRLGLPMVITAHGSDATYLKAGKMVREVCRFSLASANHVIAVSDTLRDDLIRFGVRADNVTTIHNGVDQTAFQARDEDSGGRMIVWAGRMTEEKGVEYLIRAMRKITTVFRDAVLRLVGDGPLRQDLEELATQLRLSGSVSFVGEKSHSEMVSVYAGCDLVVLPSLSEGLPMVLLEAMAAGKPVVASRVGGIPEVISEGRTGYLVSPGSPDEIADRVIELLGRPELMTEMGTLSRELVKATHTWSSVARKVVAVYARVMKEPAK